LRTAYSALGRFGHAPARDPVLSIRRIIQAHESFPANATYVVLRIAISVAYRNGD
jgi:hypothetical protein